MPGSNTASRIIACQCGQVALRASGAPILASCCFCESCRIAGHALEHLSGAPAVLRPDGGTEFVLMRKDAVLCERGADLLAAHRLTPQSPTQRTVATCCNSYMFLDFTPGHWLSLVRSRWPEADRPAVAFCTMTGDLPEGAAPACDAPQSKRFPPRFVAKLLLSWVRMGFRRPKIAFVTRSLDA